MSCPDPCLEAKHAALGIVIAATRPPVGTLLGVYDGAKRSVHSLETRVGTRHASATSNDPQLSFPRSLSKCVLFENRNRPFIAGERNQAGSPAASERSSPTPLRHVPPWPRP